jgi:hypothetical protein
MGAAMKGAEQGPSCPRRDGCANQDEPGTVGSMPEAPDTTRLAGQSTAARRLATGAPRRGRATNGEVVMAKGGEHGEGDSKL